MADRNAIRCLKNQDVTGLEDLIARYQLKAIRAAYFIVQDEQLAEDVVQDVFVHLYTHSDELDENRPFEPYLMRSVVNAALNTIRRTRRETSLDGKEDCRGLEALLSRATSVEDVIELGELQQTILSTIAGLPSRQRAAIVQRYYLEMSEEEMTTALDAPPGTVKWLLHTARNRLRDLLGQQRSTR